MQNSVFYEAFLGSVGVTVNVWDHMSRVTSQSLEQYIGWSAYGQEPITYGLINTTFRSLGGIPRRGTQRQFSENICLEDDLRSRIFGTFFVKFLACLPLL